MVRFLLLAQTAGSLASNPFWGRLGDAYGKLALLRAVGWLRMIPPLFAVAILALDLPPSFLLAAFSVLFFFTGALINGMAIGFLGYLLEISPNDRRPAYSGYFNALAAPAALLPLAGAVIADLVSLTAVFVTAIVALLLTVLLEALHVRHTLLSDCPKHLVTLTVSVTLLHGLLILLHAHRIVEGISVLASLLHL